ncbi:MAG TPA: hypothetical protein VGU02_06390, partial [Gaiellaceae bacterium]|nr:hypothetical protein [Gaiellaceae bacterium]
MIVIAVTGMVVALAAAVGPASAAPASQLTLAATPNPVVIGQAVTFTGRLTAGGAGVAGATVTFGEYFDSSCTIGPFFTVPATTDASGNYNAGTYPTTGAPAGRYYFKATSGPT